MKIGCSRWDTLTILVKINDKIVLNNAQVLGENHGRTTHDTIMEKYFAYDIKM